MIDFLNSISSQQLRELGVEDMIEYVLEINKMIVKNLYRKIADAKLMEVKQAVMKFNTDFDKITRAGLPSCWDQQGNLLPQETYETLLIEAKRKIGSTHERTTVLKGATIINYLHRDFHILWLMRTRFMEKPTYKMITNFIMENTKFSKSPSSDTGIQKKCKEWMSLTTTSAEARPPSAPQSEITK